MERISIRAKLLITIALLPGSLHVWSQDKTGIEATTVRKVADNIIQSTGFRFTNDKTNEH